jgi:hypothetical protein
MLIKKDMKNILLLLFSMAFGILANGQCQMSPTISQITCCGLNNGAIDVYVGGGTAPYNIAWSGPVSGNPAGNEINSNIGNYIISNLPVGTYIISLTDANGCQIQYVITITEPLCLVASVTSTNCLCYGDQTGSITITSAGGVAAYDVSWWGPVNGSISGWLPNSPLVVGSLPAGIYNVTVTDAAGCSTNQITVISEPPPLTVTGITSNNGIDITVGGGTPPYSYAWSTGSTTEDISNLMPGTYSVVVTDANGCTITMSFTLLPVFVLSTNAITNVVCFGDQNGAISLSASGGAAPYDVSWTGPVSGNPAGNEIVNSGGSYLITNIPAGTYTLTITDSTGNTTSQSFTITQPAPLNVNGITSNNGIDITVGGGTPPYTYAWSTGTTTEDLTNLMPGTYTVTVTDANGCTQTDSFTVQNAEILTISASVLEIFPNPAFDKLTLKMKHSNNVPFYITDNLGRTVIKGRSEFELTVIPIGFLKAGLYLLHMDHVTLTFVKE